METEMTDEKTPHDEQSDNQPPVPEGAPPEGTPEDTPPEVAGEPPEEQKPQKPQQDPTILGALTPQENAMLTSLRRQSQQIALEIGKMEIQKGELLNRIRSADEQSQSVLRQVGARLGIPEDVSWTVGGDGHARALPPQFMQAMQQGMMQGMMPGMAPAPAPQAAATASQPQQAPEGAKEK